MESAAQPVSNFHAHIDHSIEDTAASEKTVAEIVISGEVSLADFEAIVSGKAKVTFAARTKKKIADAHGRLCEAIADGRHIYGINTGFGALAGRLVARDDLQLLQQNMIYHLATGVGDPLSWHNARALMTARLIVLTKGHSGCSMDLVTLLADCLNHGLAPVVPQKGTVGASGDLTPSAHMALALMGEGAFILKDGTRLDGKKAHGQFCLTPLTLSDREGLALVNGTSAMTGVAALNAQRAETAAELALRSAAVYADIMGGRAEAWKPDFAEVRPHPGQKKAQEILLDLLDGSGRIKRECIAGRAAHEHESGAGEAIWPQDPYTLRCMPQAFGAVFDMLTFHEEIVARELNSVTDNPIIVEDEPLALHGGNFYGQHVGFASDSLVMALIKIAILLERQIARLTDETFNKGLPPFLQPNGAGLNSGFMGAQVTASALLAEMRTQAVPASIQSVPTNGNNQDVNTMGTIAARKASAVLDDLFNIVAIHSLAVAQAYELSTEREGAEPFAPASSAYVMKIRRLSPRLEADRPLSPDIQKVAEAMSAGL